MTLDRFLEQKPLYYKEIDYTRMPRAWESIREKVSLPSKIIHVIGTNGKGSTGRFLAHYLGRLGFKTGHYTSPHISRFNERIWIDGNDVEDHVLEENHQRLQQLLEQSFIDSLSYFEYTTLLAMLCFEGCEFVVLEAGLGGEYDATSVFESDLTLITPISMDHQAFLGDDIESIAKTKMRAVRKFGIIGKQTDSKIYKIARAIIRKHSVEIFRYDHFYTTEERTEAKETVKHLGFAPFFKDNLLLALAAAKFFGFEIDFSKMQGVSLQGRCQRLNPYVTIDVGHNAAAAQMLASYFKNKKITLIYNTYMDKDFKLILEILKPIIQKVEILPILNERIVDQKSLETTLALLEIDYSTYHRLEQNRHYLVFGSFTVVEEFLKRYEGVQSI